MSCKKAIWTRSALERVFCKFPWSRGICADCLSADHPCWEVWVDDEPAGYGILSIAAGEAHMLNICLARGWRGLGLGRHLMRQLLDVIRWSGAVSMFPEVRASNPIAEGFTSPSATSRLDAAPVITLHATYVNTRS